MDINCRKLSCVHNKKCVCTAKKIEIDKRSECATYIVDKDKPVEDLSKIMFKKTPEYENFRHIKKANINCHVGCMFNKNGKCLANGIIVLEGENCPLCGTFINKSTNATKTFDEKTKKDITQTKKKTTDKEK